MASFVERITSNIYFTTIGMIVLLSVLGLASYCYHADEMKDKGSSILKSIALKLIYIPIYGLYISGLFGLFFYFEALLAMKYPMVFSIVLSLTLIITFIKCYQSNIRIVLMLCLINTLASLIFLLLLLGFWHLLTDQPVKRSHQEPSCPISAMRYC